MCIFTLFLTLLNLLLNEPINSTLSVLIITVELNVTSIYIYPLFMALRGLEIN